MKRKNIIVGWVVLVALTMGSTGCGGGGSTASGTGSGTGAGIGGGTGTGSGSGTGTGSGSGSGTGSGSGSGTGTGTKVVLPSCGATFATPNYIKEIDPATSKQNQVLTWAGFPVQVYVKNSITLTGTASSFSTDDAVTGAHTAWTNALDTGPSYAYVASAPTVGMTVEFTKLSAAPKTGDPLAATVLTYDANTAVIKSAVTTIYYWDGMTDAEMSTGLAFTVTHEVGHATFLDGHSTNTADVMYYKSGTTETKTFTARDLNTLKNAYCGTFPLAPLYVSRSAATEKTIRVVTLRK